MGLSIGNGISPCFFSFSSGIRQAITQNFREVSTVKVYESLSTRWKALNMLVVRSYSYM